MELALKRFLKDDVASDYATLASHIHVRLRHPLLLLSSRQLFPALFYQHKRICYGQILRGIAYFDIEIW